jgi:hypothetical protein
MLTIYIIHGPFGDVMLSHDLRLIVACDFTYVTNAILVVRGCQFWSLEIQDEKYPNVGDALASSYARPHMNNCGRRFSCCFTTTNEGIDDHQSFSES